MGMEVNREERTKEGRLSSCPEGRGGGGGEGRHVAVSIRTTGERTPRPSTSGRLQRNFVMALSGYLACQSPERVSTGEVLHVLIG